MRLVTHRVHHATARIDGEPVAEMGAGLLLLVGFTPGDRADGLDRIAAKVLHLRIFPTGDSLFGASLLDGDGEVMLVSQLTLTADLSRGRRPNFSTAAPPEVARDLYERLARALVDAGARRVTACPFASSLTVDAHHWGPFTVLVEGGSP
jgi:D-tyrosyl-tRNA(Tyr) deacylase